MGSLVIRSYDARVSWLEDLFVALAEALQAAGVNVDAELVRGIAGILLGIGAVSVLIKVGRAGFEAAKATIGFVKRHIDDKFWEDSGKLATFLSFLLLAIAYGLYWEDQTRTLGQALLDMGKERLAQILPTAILTQAVLLCAYWLIFGRLTGASARTLAEPFRLFLGYALMFAVLVLASVIPFIVLDGDPEALGMAFLTVLGLAFFVVILPMTYLPHAMGIGQPKRTALGNVVVVLALLVLTGMFATAVAGIYSGVSRSPTVGGLLTTDVAIMTVLLLFVCYRFRAYMDAAEVPAVLPHFTDFSLAVSACAIALVSLPGSQVTLAGVPPVVIAVTPALIVATMIFLIHLRHSRHDTRRWVAFLIVAVIGGLLAGPLKALLAGPLSALARLLIPVGWAHTTALLG